ncbi:hypothetical protein RSAG8_11184, partial [Rhizoctonia solani AG-8 WAC10335]
MFGWSWDSIAVECTDFIGPAGYGFVQVSPPSEHTIGSSWWTDYQPVSYILTSKRGDRRQFENMVAICKNAGVGIIADAVINHMSALNNGTGVAGSNFTHYNYPGIYEENDFHHCGNPPGDDISDYNNRTQVQTCELLNLADLATDTERVRSRLAEYLNDLISLGVVGLRIDAAKHIAAGDIFDILSRIKSNVYITQEVIFGTGEPILPSEYVENGDVQEFRYASALRNAFQADGIAKLQDVRQSAWIDSKGANVFVANHDTERNEQSLSYRSGSIYTLAHIFMLAYPYGTPTILSSYTFSDYDIGAPINGTGACAGSKGANGWLCQHRWAAIQGMVKFRNGIQSLRGNPHSNASTPLCSRTVYGRSRNWIQSGKRGRCCIRFIPSFRRTKSWGDYIRCWELLATWELGAGKCDSAIFLGSCMDCKHNNADRIHIFIQVHSQNHEWHGNMGV